MTDEQILKRLAEIEGVEGDLVDNEYAYGFPAHEGLWFWNPLINWGDLGPLIEKYGMCVAYNSAEAQWEAMAGDNGPETSAGTLAKAVCLAIIEACKDQV